jgi:hypothetical protein
MHAARLNPPQADHPRACASRPSCPLGEAMKEGAHPETTRPPGGFVRRRVVLHFPGFEPLDAAAHRLRYARAAALSARVWSMDIAVGPLVDTGAGPEFDVVSTVGGRRTESRVILFDHDVLVTALTNRPLPVRLVAGYRSALQVAWQGGLIGYFRHAWRFGLFFVFPFLLVALALGIGLALALAPLRLGFPAGLPLWHLVWSVPAGIVFFRVLFLPNAERLHTLHLFADWELAVAMATPDRGVVASWLEETVTRARAALAAAGEGDCDEILITSHSMGSSIAAQVVGRLLEDGEDLAHGKPVAFVTLGGAILQCALLRPAHRLRARIGLIARARNIVWLEVQCLTDAIHFYKTRVAEITGHADAPQPAIVTIRFKHMLSAKRYRRIKLDFLRVHRQYVLGPDVRAPFDFTLMTAGPLAAPAFATFSTSNLPDLAAHGVAQGHDWKG